MKNYPVGNEFNRSDMTSEKTNSQEIFSLFNHLLLKYPLHSVKIVLHFVAPEYITLLAYLNDNYIVLVLYVCTSFLLSLPIPLRETWGQ